MATQDQQKDAERLTRHIQREQLVSSMSDTKWVELQAAMASVTPCPNQPLQPTARAGRLFEGPCSSCRVQSGTVSLGEG